MNEQTTESAREQKRKTVEESERARGMKNEQECARAKDMKSERAKMHRPKVAVHNILYGIEMCVALCVVINNTFI